MNRFPRHTLFSISRLSSAPRVSSGLLVMLFAFAIGSLGFAEDTTKTGSTTVSFNRDIRPILTDKCFQCHGPDPKHAKAS